MTDATGAQESDAGVECNSGVKARRWGRGLPSALLAALLIFATGCGRSPALDWGLDSPQAVAEAVVAALDARDVRALERLSVNEQEFRQLVWPRQPAARPERNIPWDYAWRSLAARSRYQLRGRLSEWVSGQRFTVVGLKFAGETTDYGAYRVHRRSVVTLRDTAGRVETTRVFGSLIEQGGRYRVFSYVVD
jgi:hypothetical protein